LIISNVQPALETVKPKMAKAGISTKAKRKLA
jgi:hypothetical protein